MHEKLLIVEKTKFEELYEEILADDGIPNIMGRIDDIMMQVQEAQHGEKSETSSMLSDEEMPSSGNRSKKSHTRSKTYTNVNDSLGDATIVKRREQEPVCTDRTGHSDDEEVNMTSNKTKFNIKPQVALVDDETPDLPKTG